MNLVNRSGQIAVEIFNALDTRLKPAEKSRVEGQGGDGRSI